MNDTEHTEDENFAYLVRSAPKTDAVLNSHIESECCDKCRVSIADYRLQNELIACTENEIVFDPPPPVHMRPHMGRTPLSPLVDVHTRLT